MWKALNAALIATASIGVYYGSSGTPIDSVLKESDLEFPNIAPGRKYKVQKVYDPVSKTIKFKSKDFASAEDLVKMANENVRFETLKYGAIIGGLRTKFDDAKEEDKFRIVVGLKMAEGIKHPSKFDATPDELERHSKAFLNIQPVISLNTFFSGHGLGMPISIDNKSGIYELKKYQLRHLMFDKNLVSIEEYFEYAPTVKAFSILPSLIGQGTVPPLSSLARSAYHHSNTAVPATAGAGVKAATFEEGITPSFLTCTGLSGANIELGGNAHSDATWRVMTYAAPGATFYHRKYFSYEEQTDYIVSNGIQTSSLSRGGGIIPWTKEFREMDDFAYKWPYTVFCTPTDNNGTDLVASWGGYNAISVGNVRHRNFSTFDLRPPQCGGGCTQTKNPFALYNTSICITRPTSSACASDREMPSIVAPGFTPTILGSSDCASIVAMQDPCQPGISHTCGTSLSAPVANGIAADIISANSRMVSWPEKVRATMLLTAQNVTGSDWNSSIDGEDGNGVIHGAGAVLFAQTHIDVPTNNTAVVKAMGVGSVYTSNWSTTLSYNILIPSSKPAGKNLRILLTWDGNPSLNFNTNELSDLDLIVNTSTNVNYSSQSWEGNIEVVNIPGSSLVSGSTAVVTISKVVNRIPSIATTNYFYYAIGWDWVATHAP